MKNPNIIPKIGEIIKAENIFVRPETLRILKPPYDTEAPTSPPIRA
jgi:hypothetical protein